MPNLVNGHAFRVHILKFILHFVILHNLEAAWAYKFSGAWKSIQGIGSVVIVESLRQGKIMPILRH